ncbi:MAG: glycosyltransferase family 39 protein [Candidatus Eisenbacteria bacterium]
MTSLSRFVRGLSDRWIAALTALLTFAAIALRLAAYGLTWDEPTYFRFARLQRHWLSELLTFRWRGLFAPERIAEVFLQDRMKNGHPPLHELWMGIAGSSMTWLGVPDALAFRAANALVAAITAALLYLLLRRAFTRTVAIGGVLAYLAVPCVWAHAHLAATESWQNLFWVAGAFVLPRALRDGGRWLWLFLAVGALGFFGKFTNLLVPICLLGVAAVLGAIRTRRFWIASLSGLVIGPALLLILDPYFWPWQGGLARFADYLEQVTTRGKWVPLAVYYQGKNWGFSPPWHYRPVELAASLPSVLSLLALLGLGLIVRLAPAALRAGWSADPRVRDSAPSREAAPSAGSCIDDRSWLAAFACGVLVLALVIGWMPNAPNHDGTRQFVFAYLGVAVAVSFALEWLSARRFGNIALLAPVAAFVISLAAEPFGLSYRAEWLGGVSGAWRRGYELTFWGEAIDRHLLDAVMNMHTEKGRPPEILSIPKLDYFEDMKDHWRAFLPPPHPEVLAVDAVPAYYENWMTPALRQQGGLALRFATRRPLDGILVLFRRSWVQDNIHELLAELTARGDIRLVAETRVDGIVLAQCYAVVRSREVSWQGDPTGARWFVPASLPEVLAAAPNSAR